MTSFKDKNSIAIIKMRIVLSKILADDMPALFAGGMTVEKKQQTQQALLGVVCAGLLVAIIQSFPCFQGGMLYLGPA